MTEGQDCSDMPKSALELYLSRGWVLVVEEPKIEPESEPKIEPESGSLDSVPLKNNETEGELK